MELFLRIVGRKECNIRPSTVCEQSNREQSLANEQQPVSIAKKNEFNIRTLK
jgi:hypothetical protein